MGRIASLELPELPPSEYKFSMYRVAAEFKPELVTGGSGYNPAPYWQNEISSIPLGCSYILAALRAAHDLYQPGGLLATSFCLNAKSSESPDFTLHFYSAFPGLIISTIGLKIYMYILKMYKT